MAMNQSAFFASKIYLELHAMEFHSVFQEGVGHLGKKIFIGVLHRLLLIEPMNQ